MGIKKYIFMAFVFFLLYIFAYPLFSDLKISKDVIWFSGCLFSFLVMLLVALLVKKEDENVRGSQRRKQ